jgi:hypothetical protein
MTEDNGEPDVAVDVRVRVYPGTDAESLGVRPSRSIAATTTVSSGLA